MGKEWYIFAFLIEFDNCAQRDEKKSPGADEALKKVIDAQIAIAFVTNGGGLPEVRKRDALIEFMHLHESHVSVDQIIVPHTPFRWWINDNRSKLDNGQGHVLIVGLNDERARAGTITNCYLYILKISIQKNSFNCLWFAKRVLRYDQRRRRSISSYHCSTMSKRISETCLCRAALPSRVGDASVAMALEVQGGSDIRRAWLVSECNSNHHRYC